MAKLTDHPYYLTKPFFSVASNVYQQDKLDLIIDFKQRYSPNVQTDDAKLSFLRVSKSEPNASIVIPNGEVTLTVYVSPVYDGIVENALASIKLYFTSPGDDFIAAERIASA